MGSYSKEAIRRHKLDDNSFLWYSGSLMGVSLLLVFILTIITVTLGKQFGVTLWLPGWTMPAAISACLVFVFFSQWFVMKHSEVLTAPGLVVYRKRKLFAGPERVVFVIYTIKGVKSLAGGAKRRNSGFEGASGSIFVAGDIEVSNVYVDGREIAEQKSRRRLMIPSCFTAMSAIYKTLEDMKEDRAEESL